MNTTVKNESVGSEFAAFTTETRTPNFDRVAKIYRWMELWTFGPLLSRCRTALFPELASTHRALVLGDGDGRFTAELLRANSEVRIDAVDASPAMLEALLRRAEANARRVYAHCADAREWQPENAQYDLVVTHFFLDCLTTEECRALAARLRDALSPSAMWIVSEFAIPEGWFGRIVAGPLISVLYRAFGVLTGLRIRSLPDYRAALRDAGFALARQRTRLRGLLVSEMWAREA
ncbi:MAG: methyltransferase domain-containing protein [Terracidiphilus sp.]